MVSDGSSDNGRKLPSEPDRSSSHGQPADAPPLTLPNLTHELAQLLAASIAQNQARNPGMPTGADLASLASLVSASQRGLAPTFRDGLSALAYNQPSNASQPQIDQAVHHDDEPMPIPSTWRQPTYGDDDRWFRQQMGAAVLGLLAGLVIVVPTVLWLSGWLSGSQKSKMPDNPFQTAASEPRAPEVKTVKVQVRPVEKPETAAQYVTGSIDPRAAAEAARTTPAPPPPPAVMPVRAPAPEPARPRVEDLLAQGARRIESGDVPGAREIFVALESTAQGPAIFALAETYDPNMLAAWGTRGVAADVARARALYAKALDLGVGRAQSRLEALK